MRRLILVGLLAFAVALTGTAYAEVQNIKVSGDLDIKAVSQSNYDLKLTQENRAGTDAGGDAADSDDDDVRFALSTVRVRVDADLTDNVSTSVRLLNQRVWDSLGAADSDDEGSIQIDNAYVTLKEFLYSPLTVIAGRQNLTYGTGFIVGNGQLADPTGTFAGLATAAADSQAQHGQEYSAFNSYDAIRLILDYAPLTVEGVWAKVNETGTDEDDETLYGALVNYKLDRWEAEVEPYWFYKDDEAGGAAGGTAGGVITVNDATSTLGALRTYEIARTHTVGLRVAASPVENLKLSGEGAHQFGEIIDLGAGGITYQERDRDAWGANIYANYTWAQVPWTPSTGVGWTFYSGEETSGITDAPVGGRATGLDQNDDFGAWDPVYRGSFTTYIQDFFSGRDAAPNLYATFDAQDTNATTNRHLISGDVQLSPMEDVTLWGRWTHVRFDEEPRPGRSTHVGDELDVKALYDYTDDVQLSAWGGWFFPGDYYDDPTSSNSRGNQLAWTAGAGGSVKF